MIITIFTLLFSFSVFGFDSVIPERFSPGNHFFETENPSSSVIFSSRFARVLTTESWNPKFLFGKDVFGRSRPLSKENFNLLSNEVGGAYDVSYPRYVQQWLVEKVSPFYFREVLNIKAKNENIATDVLNRIFFQLINKATLKSNCPEIIDTISCLKHYVQTKLTISLTITDIESVFVGFKKDEVGLINRPLIIDFSSFVKLSRNSEVSDEKFYQKWMQFSFLKIKNYIMQARRLMVIENEIAFEMKRDPLFLFSSYPGDFEHIYEQLISGERNILKKANYQMKLLKVNLKKGQIKIFKDGFHKYPKINQIEKLVQIFELNKITHHWVEADKYGERSLENLFGINDSPSNSLWSPIRLMKGDLEVLKGKFNGEYFVASRAIKQEPYIFPVDSNFTKDKVREETLKRKRKVLYGRIAQRLSLKFPLILDLGQCYSTVVFCFPENFHQLLIDELVRVSDQGQEREYLEEINSSLFESAIY
jgi:hypothetical protein